jgi:putative FmdB family regulatory protein
VPLYEYQCNNCGHRFEKIVKFSDEPLKVCPQCGKETIEQLLSAPATHFKGGGWYVTDYARKNSVPSSSGSSDKKSDVSASSTDSKSESKSDSKSDATPSTPKSDSSSSSGSDAKK